MPVTLAEVKRSLRISGTHHDAELSSAIAAATEHLQQRIDRPLVSQSFEWSCDRFPAGAIQLSHEPVASVTEIKYDDTEGTEQTVDAADYALNIGNRQVYRTDSTSWPTTSGLQRSVRLVYVSGYGTAAAVPAIFKRMILELVGVFFYDPALENPTALDGFERLLASYVHTGYTV